MRAKLFHVVPVVAIVAVAMMAGQVAAASSSARGREGTAGRSGVSHRSAIWPLPESRPNLHLASALRSPDLAGYAVTPSTPITAKATIKIPSITCAPSGASGIAPGVYLFGGYSGYSGAFAGALCGNGQVTYNAYITINGTQTTVFAVQPGNTVVVSISETSSKTSATVHDVTTGQLKSLSGVGSDKTQVFVGDGGWFIGSLSLNNLVGVPRFKSYPVNSVSVGGQALGSVQPALVERVKGSTLQLLPSAITGGNAFKVAFKHT
jgi:hypothetical protein